MATTTPTTTTSTSRSRPHPAGPSRPASAAVPLALWPTTQPTPAGSPEPAPPLSGGLAGQVPASLAARIVYEYSRPGQLVCDPHCDGGITLVEAARAGRRALGITADSDAARRTTDHLDRFLTEKQRAATEVRVAAAQSLGEVAGDLAGQVDLIITIPPDRTPPSTTRQANSSDPATAAPDRVLADYRQLLRPDGLLVTVTTSPRRGGRLTDRAAHTVDRAQHAGFGYLQHVIALHAEIRDSHLTPHPDTSDLARLRRERRAGHPAHLRVHLDVLVFRAGQDPR